MAFGNERKKNEIQFEFHGLMGFHRISNKNNSPATDFTLWLALARVSAHLGVCEKVIIGFGIDLVRRSFFGARKFESNIVSLLKLIFHQTIFNDSAGGVRVKWCQWVAEHIRERTYSSIIGISVHVNIRRG